MTFHLASNEYFTGVICMPGGDRQVIVTARATRDDAVRRTVAASHRRGWDWIIELVRENADEDDSVTILSHWSSLQGDLPPEVREVEITKRSDKSKPQAKRKSKRIRLEKQLTLHLPVYKSALHLGVK